MTFYDLIGLCDDIWQKSQPQRPIYPEFKLKIKQIVKLWPRDTNGKPIFSDIESSQLTECKSKILSVLGV